jgi:AraC-like DNA-binding protein
MHVRIEDTWCAQVKKVSVVIFAEREDHALYRTFNFEREPIELHELKSTLDVIRRCHAEIVLIDCGPDLQRGLNLLRESKEYCLYIPIIFVTDDESETAEIRAIRSGARYFFRKPLNIGELSDSILNLLNLKRSSRERRTSFIPKKNGDDAPTPDLAVMTDKPVSVIRAIRFIEDHLSSAISLNCIAGSANLSKYHFCRIFKKYTGMNPVQYVRYARMEKAKILLKKNNMTISMVASDVGYHDLSNFDRQFKRHTGMTPNDYKSSVKRDV